MRPKHKSRSFLNLRRMIRATGVELTPREVANVVESAIRNGFVLQDPAGELYLVPMGARR